MSTGALQHPEDGLAARELERVFRSRGQIPSLPGISNCDLSVYGSISDDGVVTVRAYAASR
jgi:hypothetical protein